MSTKSSLFYNEALDVHIFQEMLDDNYYLETQHGRILLTELMAKKMTERFKTVFREQ